MIGIYLMKFCHDCLNHIYTYFWYHVCLYKTMNHPLGKLLHDNLMKTKFLKAKIAQFNVHVETENENIKLKLPEGNMN